MRRPGVKIKVFRNERSKIGLKAPSFLSTGKRRLKCTVAGISAGSFVTIPLFSHSSTSGNKISSFFGLVNTLAGGESFGDMGGLAMNFSLSPSTAMLVAT